MSGSTSGPRVGPRVAPTRAPTRDDFPVFSPSRTPHETSHEGVHGRAHEWTVGVHLSCFHLFCSLTKTPNRPALRDTARLSQRYPPIARYEVFGVSTWPIGCDTPSPFSDCFPLGERAKWRCDTPLKRGISAILARYPLKIRQMGAMPPL